MRRYGPQGDSSVMPNSFACPTMTLIPACAADACRKKELKFKLSIYILCILLAAFLWRKPSLLMVCYVVVILIAFLKWYTRGDLLFYSVAFFVGPLGE
jgi:hypothetical protein